MEIVKLMKKVVPEYKSKNSIFEVLDNQVVNKVGEKIRSN
jgi:hypothetical protein